MATLVYLNHARAVTLGAQVDMAIVMNQAEGYQDAYATLAQHSCYGEARVVPYVETAQDALTGQASLIFPYGKRAIQFGDLVWMPEKKETWLYGPKGFLPLSKVKNVSYQMTKKAKAKPGAEVQLPKGVEFSISETLNHLLMMTDISDTVPAFALRIPYPNTYFNFQHHAALVLDYEGKAHRIQALQLSERGTKNVRVLIPVVRLFGNIDVPFPPILINDESAPVVNLLVKDHGFDKVMKHIVKLLLYINGRSITEEEYHKLNPVRANRVRQTTYVLPADPSKPIKIGMIREQVSEGRKVPLDPEYTPISAHYRRGHLKMVRFGPKMAQSKVKWIMPTVVNFHLLAPGMTKEVALKMYKVTL